MSRLSVIEDLRSPAEGLMSLAHAMSVASGEPGFR